VRAALAAACLLVCGAPAVVCAQTTAPAADIGRLQFGALGVTPTFRLSNVGVDTNVFNTDAAPERDFTATLAPGARTTLRLGRARFTGQSTAEWLFFMKASEQRSTNFSQDGVVDVPLSYLTPRVGGTYGTTRQRLNAELDLRARRKERSWFAGASIRLSARTSADVEWRERAFDIADDTFLGVSLRDELNRTTRVGTLALNYRLTPLTTLVVRGEREADRFEFSTLRDSDWTRVMAGVDMKPLALFAGSALVGVRQFTPRDARVDGFTGLVAAIGMTYNMRETTKVSIKFDRDLDYSFEPERPYFLLNGVTLGLTQVLGADWDVVGSAGRTSLGYRALRQATAPFVGQTDRSLLYHTSLGYHFGAGARVGFDVDYVRRDSTAAGRDYHGFRAGGSFTYGL
jgi:hypothetical protein